MESSTVASLSDVIKSLDFSVLTTYTLEAIAATATVVIGLIAIRKGYAFLKRQIKGA